MKIFVKIQLAELGKAFLAYRALVRTYARVYDRMSPEQARTREYALAVLASVTRFRLTRVSFIRARRRLRTEYLEVSSIPDTRHGRLFIFELFAATLVPGIFRRPIRADSINVFGILRTFSLLLGIFLEIATDPGFFLDELILVSLRALGAMDRRGIEVGE